MRLFSSLLFLMIVLLMASVASEAHTLTITPSAGIGFAAGMILYALTLLFILLESRLALRSRILNYLANTQLIITLFLMNFVLLGQRLLGELITPESLMTVGLYLFGIFVFHASQSGIVYAKRQIRFLLPFALPFLLFCVVADLATFVPLESTIGSLLYTTNPITQLGLLAGAAIVFFIVILIALPPVITHIWQCRPLPHGELYQRLTNLCQRAHFRHGGMLTWPVMHDSVNAAIIGVIPSSRYVMFSKGLLADMPEPLIEAVLAHEIGHSKHKHLLIYPFLLFGGVVLVSFYTKWTQSDLQDIPTFIVTAVIMVLYFRLVYGYFSRLFERQADLYGCEIGLPPKRMIDALDRVGILSGHSHLRPSWHHYGIQERIDFLRAVEQDASRIDKHHRRVRRALIIYAVALVFGLVLLSIT